MARLLEGTVNEDRAAYAVAEVVVEAAEAAEVVAAVEAVGIAVVNWSV